MGPWAGAQYGIKAHEGVAQLGLEYQQQCCYGQERCPVQDPVRDRQVITTCQQRSDLQSHDRQCDADVGDPRLPGRALW